jgi:hypothetical protein
MISVQQPHNPYVYQRYRVLVKPKAATCFYLPYHEITENKWLVLLFVDP